ncbi:MAG: Uma2 family endonuclease [Planctomycetes bacterium]|nr:Uma2 family endonuclease [Planctomycetota bacterium]
MATVLEQRLLTAEEYLKSSLDDVPTELVRGRILEMNRSYTAHGYFVARFIYILQRFLEGNDVGRIVGGDAGVITERNPDTVRGPDVAYYSYERIPRGSLPEGYWPSTPELVFEIRSPDDRWKDIMKKVGEYLSAGVVSVAVIDPQAQQIQVFSSDREATRLNADDQLTFPDTLPGFSVPVKNIFE